MFGQINMRPGFLFFFFLKIGSIMQQRPGLEVLMKSILGCWSGAGGSIHLQVITKGRLSSGLRVSRPRIGHSARPAAQGGVMLLSDQIYLLGYFKAAAAAA